MLTPGQRKVLRTQKKGPIRETGDFGAISRDLSNRLFFLGFFILGGFLA